MAELPFDFDPSGFAQGATQLLESPENRAALLALGVGLMQPPGFGDTPASQIGRAVGSAGETLSRREAETIRRQEADSKQDLRASQAIASEARASTAATRAQAATDRLGMERFRQEAINDRQRLGAQVRLSGLYQQYVRDANRANQQATLFDPRATTQPVLGFQEWVQQNPSLAMQPGILPPTTEAAPGASGQPSAPANTPPPAEYPPMPPNPATRQVNQIYTTPRGPMRWHADGKWRPAL